MKLVLKANTTNKIKEKRRKSSEKSSVKAKLKNEQHWLHIGKNRKLNRTRILKKGQY